VFWDELLRKQPILIEIRLELVIFPRMRAYFIRRLLLVPVTLFGITMLVFLITRIVPGGPLERAIAEANQAAIESRGTTGVGTGTSLSEDQIQQLKEYYGFDKPWYLSYLQWLGKLVQGDLGRSYIYNKPVWDVIASKFPISIYFGVLTLLFTYGICIPLGILKAIKHKTVADNISSITIFAGYAIPNYVLGSILILFFAARLEWFPLGGFVSDEFYEKGLWGKTLDLIHHTTLPLMCYLVSSFAFLTLLMKNNLMDNLAADYIRTAIAKGVSFRNAVVSHAFRNSIIPIATTFGQNLGLILTGSFLIEVIFDIDGFGLLGLNSVLNRDYPVVMGILFISSLLLVLGNILSDLIVALIDPRIRFN
jgi:microcin C transport system permease protein